MRKRSTPGVGLSGASRHVTSVELQRALQILEDGERVVAESGARGFLPELLYARADVHAALGDHVAQRAALKRGLQVAAANGAHGWEKRFDDALAGRANPVGPPHI
jgi:hypothetical protein